MVGANGRRRATLRNVAWLVSDAHVLASAEHCTARGDRRRGLLGRDGIDGALVIDPCRWVHTFGMRFPIDVAYVDETGSVVKTTRMSRHRVGLPVKAASWVIEAEAGAFDRWGLRVGDAVELRHDASDAEPDATSLGHAQPAPPTTQDPPTSEDASS